MPTELTPVAGRSAVPVFPQPPPSIRRTARAFDRYQLYERISIPAAEALPAGAACQYDLFGGCYVIDLPNPTKTQVKVFVPGNELEFAEEGVKRAYAASYQLQNKSGLGSGIGIRTELAADGSTINYILTNRHVVQESDGENAKTMMVTSLWTGETFKGEVVKVLPEGSPDMALVAMRTPQPLFTIPVANSKTVAFGQRVYAIGNPLGLAGSVTAGIISHPRRPAEELEAGSGYVIQFDAPISPGNSGGPLITQDGMLIGINTFTIPGDAGHPAQNINFAYPADKGLEELLQMNFPLAAASDSADRIAA